MTNPTLGGYRFVRNESGGQNPNTIEMHVVNNNTLALFDGDVLKLQADGSAYPAAATDVEIIGVMNGAVQYWDGENMRKGNYLPAATTYGSVLGRQSIVNVILAEGSLFEVDCDDAVTATTEAAYQALIGTNCDITATAGSTTTGRSGHCLDISDTKTGAAQIRIRAISRRIDQDFASDRVKLIVKINESHTAKLAGV